MISKSLKGPQFEIKIHAFSSMTAIFFDGVDEQQVAKALQLGGKMADRLWFQNIVTMNEDALPADLPKDFDLEQYIMPNCLMNATENGGLFGIRFG